MKNVKALAILNILFFLGHLAPSQLTQLRLFNNQTIGEVSAKYPALFTPAGFTFSIWGLIYLTLTAFCLYHAVKAFRQPTDHEANQNLKRIGYLFMLNNLATGAWTIAWVQEWLVASVVLIGIQLATLLAIHLRLGIFDAGRSVASRWFTQVPLSLYFGWIIIATVANASAALVGLGWNGSGWGPEVWATLMVLVASLVVVYVVVARTNPYIGMVGIWALLGILLKHRNLGAEDSFQLIITAGIGMALVAGATAFIFFRNTKARQMAGRPGQK